MNINETTGMVRYVSNEVYRSSAVQRTSEAPVSSVGRNERNSYINRQGIGNVQRLGNSAQAAINNMDKLEDKSLYQNYYAKSSDLSYVEVNTSDSSSAKENYTVEVDKLATGQTNQGNRLAEDGVYAGTAGRQTFQIDVDGQSHQFTIDIAAGETNEQVLRKMANAVNEGNIGINAWVSNGRNDTSSLVFQSEKTGDLAENKFTVSDVNGGNLVADTGMSQVKQHAQDAVYTVNNRQYTSHSNEVELDDDLSVTLKQETREPVQISTERDMQPAIEQAHQFVNAYNNLLSDSKTGTNGDTWLNEYLNLYSKSYESAFKQAGITRNSDGSLSINEKSLNQAAANGDLERIFTQDGNASYGIANRIQHIAKNVVNSPSTYINSKQNAGIGFVSRNVTYGFWTAASPYTRYGLHNYSLVNFYS
jgi:flagellar hook-associated protein 2